MEMSLSFRPAVVDGKFIVTPAGYSVPVGVTQNGPINFRWGKKRLYYVHHLDEHIRGRVYLVGFQDLENTIVHGMAGTSLVVSFTLEPNFTQMDLDRPGIVRPFYGLPFFHSFRGRILGFVSGDEVEINEGVVSAGLGLTDIVFPADVVMPTMRMPSGFLVSSHPEMLWDPIPVLFDETAIVGWKGTFLFVHDAVVINDLEVYKLFGGEK